ncbi:4-alpha-glucanotransferase [Streptomyces sp. TRM43335]|uniref:4-alpha-glucanotransferase n=1 Tax=Streptomyces taklimakanensis TaxID=2569853 RepID=A0A6G2BAZ8_9ACTN|nr:4-alpha-glucanotransferase [Streptomyces taklimakanensis]MTE19072.1 4-alpha-glucanotransferase [Streptomyces taklimakanensis]
MSRLAHLAAAHGVCTSYDPAPGRTLQVPDTTIVEVLAALGVDASTPDAVREALDRHAEEEAARLLPPTVVVRAPHPPGPGRDAPPTAEPSAVRGVLPPLPDGTVLSVATEDGRVLARGTGGTGPGLVGEPLPPGCHALRAEAPDGRTARATLIVAPDRFPAPPGRSYGLLVQLYSLLSSRSWGMGDLADLADLAAWSGRAVGAGFIQLNPLHAAVPPGEGESVDPSPYRPSSRRFADPVHLRIEEIPEYGYLRGEARRRVDELAARAAELRDATLTEDGRIDRDAVWALKREALELLRTVPLSPGRHVAYCDFLAEQGQALEDHAVWCALAEVHGSDWRSWPGGLDDPRSPATARARVELMDRVDFHSRLAWLTDAQLARAQRTARDAGMSVGLVHDLALGVHPSGAEAWALRDFLADGVSVGAPPDAFNAQGQDWGLPPWRPDALAAAGYAPYRSLLSGLLRHTGGLRIDHVMGLFRLWWVPEGRPPTEGAYVRYDAEAMLGMLALEAYRAGAVVIGEDLGTVEPGVRAELAGRGVLGTSVLWFERDYEHLRTPHHEMPQPLHPRDWRADCLATATTHDLPSTAARLSGDHVRLRADLGLLTGTFAAEQTQDAAETAEWVAYLDRLGLLPEGAGDEESEVRAIYRFLARTPAKMVGVWLPDGVGDRRPQNVPGTAGDRYPNWRLPVAGDDGRPVTLEELVASPRLRALLETVYEELHGPRERRIPAPGEHGGQREEDVRGTAGARDDHPSAPREARHDGHRVVPRRATQGHPERVPPGDVR